MQTWVKQGRIYNSRAQIPTIFSVDSKIWRIYFADRTSENKSFIRYLDVEAGNPSHVLDESKKSLLDFGPLGSFDQSGIMPSWVVRKANGTVYMYYIGWALRKDVPYSNSVGLAISRDGGTTFSKNSLGPLIGTSKTEPYFTGTTCVVNFQADLYYPYKMWHLSCTEWVLVDDKPEPRYNLKEKYSSDGISWQDSGFGINYNSPFEGGICRASVLDHSPRQMWYCYRKLVNYRTDPKQSYKIGFAERPNPTNDTYALGPWIRKDELLDLSQPYSDGFDSQMQCYPFVIQHQDRLFMFYNGNGFGQTGIGYATLALS